MGQKTSQLGITCYPLFKMHLGIVSLKNLDISATPLHRPCPSILLQHAHPSSCMNAPGYPVYPVCSVPGFRVCRCRSAAMIAGIGNTEPD
ncbi:hypothetical protein I7I50_07825 [Histoplasma capsulatum G186AR]|uniref:Uncharacterized protein n=1 Tax=Ajellomyces capsulatus TaxID=5037 RepID=A0A8H7YH97_AJECA|nr:hypothetical protein I7I52_08341 [Histoplasma capsulatum]QSS68419.1 hypothetical protein I7I50_07825 [Histoplasma capsulatum G186AR]